MSLVSGDELPTDGAGDGIQTRGLYLGRVPLYQLSYARTYLVTPTGFEPVLPP